VRMRKRMTDRTPEEEAFVAMLIDWGALYVGGVDDDGNELYFMDAEIMKEVCRPFYDMWMADIDKGLLELYELGLLDVTYNEQLQPRFSVRTEPREDF
jgi:hypothetical protein